MAEYPLPKFHFEVQWGGTRIGFTEVTGLEVSTDKIEYRDGASKEYHKIRMPGMQTFGDLTLKRGIFAGDNEFYEWWNSVALNTIQRRDITISLLNENHEPVVIWKVKNAWPTKVTSTDLNSSGNETAIETLVLAHEGLTMENG
ncbi:phage tail protein [Lysobacter sp. CCNWLW3]|uniref:phage tail protein n=1 Tax=unclassified Lysobacter TaxID=2635362 RepID=UPI002FD6A0D3